MNFSELRSWVKANRIKLKPEELLELVKKAKNGDTVATNQIILCLLDVVLHQTKLFLSCGVDCHDLYDNGIEGIYIALKKFDFGNNTGFRHYASFCIRSAIRNKISLYTGFSQGQLVDRGVVLKEQRIQLVKTGECSLEFLVEKTGFSQDKVEDLINSSFPISLDAEDDDGNSHGDLLHSDFSVEDFLFKNESSDLFESLLEDFTDQERKVIKHHFGIGCKEISLEEIGRILNRSKERMRQIELKMLVKLRKKLCKLGITKVSDIL